MTRCEDYPCCGHTDLDPCERQPYDNVNYYHDPHLTCDHEAGICDVYEDEAHEWDYDDTDSNGVPWCYGCDAYATNCDGK